MKRISNPFPCFSRKDTAPRPLTLLLGILVLTAVGEAAATFLRRLFGFGSLDLALTDVVLMPLVATPLLYFLVVRPTVRRQSQIAEQISRAEAKYRALVEQSAEGIFVWDPGSHRILEANNRLLGWLRYTREAITSLTINDLLAFEPSADVSERMERVLREGSLGDRPRLYRRSDGTPMEVETNASVVSFDGNQVVLVNVRDVGDIRRAYLTRYDPLTGLPNRQMFLDRLGETVAKARQGMVFYFAVMLLNLDRFKFVIDALGHSMGDLLLQAVAERISAVLREEDAVSRLEGDEFGILVEDIPEIQEAAGGAKRILMALEEPFRINGQDLFVTAGVGISLYPMDGDDPEILLKCADTALYHAKELGRNNYQFYTAGLKNAVSERVELESALRKALEREEFQLYYQPQVEIKSGRIVGLEALIRWNHPEMGIVTPDRFIHLAEENGLILPMGDWVLRESCAQSEVWQQKGLMAGRMAVNLSARQFRQPGLEGKVARILEEGGFDANLLELELTESLLMQDAAATVHTLWELRSTGVHIAVDDFGTGYSSLSYLKRFRVDRLKIDRSFIRDLTLDVDAGAIVEAVISLAHTLRLKAIAEGVETEEQLEYLRSVGCDEVQGYFFSRPLPAAAAEEFLRRSRLEGKAVRWQETA